MPYSKPGWICLVLAIGWWPPMCPAQSPPHFVDIVQPYVDQGKFVGAIGVVVSRDGIFADPMVGYADLEAKKPMQHDTLFWLASTSKTFQATAVMMLVDDGKVDLDAPVSKYLRDFKPQIAVSADGKEVLRDPAHPITVRMLLNHTHGMTSYDSAHPRRTDCCSPEEEVRQLVSRPLQFEPGSRFAYSNAGPDTASRVVEVVSGQDFETFLNERLLKPLGMVDTTYFPDEKQLARLAVTYMTSPEGKQVRAPNEVFLTAPYNDRKIRHAPGGGLFSTADDLSKFACMLLRRGEFGGRRYLSEAALAEMTRNQIPAEIASQIPQPPGGHDLPVSYGLGWGVSASGAFFHPGVTMTDIRVDPAHSFATILLTQHAQDPVTFEIYLKLLDAAIQNIDVSRPER